MYSLYGNVTQRHNATMSNCCGSRIKTKVPKHHANSIGICVWEGVYFKERSTPLMEIKHLHTRNGPLTISIRKEY